MMSTLPRAAPTSPLGYPLVARLRALCGGNVWFGRRIDVEGSEFELVAGTDWSQMRIGQLLMEVRHAAPFRWGDGNAAVTLRQILSTTPRRSTLRSCPSAPAPPLLPLRSCPPAPALTAPPLPP
jgi:hypothetical protein